MRYSPEEKPPIRDVSEDEDVRIDRIYGWTNGRIKFVGPDDEDYGVISCDLE